MAGVLVRSAILIAAAATALSVHAGPIAVFGDANGSRAVTTFLLNNKLDAKNLETDRPDNLDGFDVAIAIRGNGTPAVKDFVAGGGLLITEFAAAEWALDELNLLDADSDGVVFNGKDAKITFTPAGLKLGLGKGLGDAYADGNRTNAQVTLLNIGAGVDVLGTHSVVMIGGNFGDGYTLINSLAWSEELPPGDSPTGQWLLNAVNVEQTQPVPEPGTLALAGLAFACLTLARRRRSA